jgi:GntR family transcriptional regulator
MLDHTKPVYQRLRDVIAAGILNGDHGDGDMLPSVRQLATEHGANPLTVAKAYQSFQDEGLIVVRRGVGMFVAPGAAAQLRTRLRAEFLASIWPPVAEQIRLLDIDQAELFDQTPA